MQKDDGMNSLMGASEYGHLPIVKYLINKGAGVNATAQNGKTALIFACQNGHMSVVKYLISQTAVELQHVDVGGKSAIEFANENGYAKIASLLVKTI